MSEDPIHRNGQSRGEAPVAVVLTWLLPGAGHFYLGRWAFGLVALVLVEGLYAVGWYLSDGRTFEFLDPELRGPLATLLTPELGNLGGMIAQLKAVGYGLAEPSRFPAHIALGGILCGISGIANLFVMSHAHLEARAPRAPRSHRAHRAIGSNAHPAFLVALAWVLPGLGHIAQGRKLRGAIVFVLLVGFFFLGTWMAEGSNLSRERHFYYWSGQILVGLPAIASELISGNHPVTSDIPLRDPGLLFACMPGMLNVLAMLDVYGVAERRWLGSEEAPESNAPASESAEEVTS